MFETEVVVKKICCIEESTCDIFGLFGAPRIDLAPPWRLGAWGTVPLLLRPCIWPSVTVARRVTRVARGAVILSNFELQILNR